MKIRMYIFSYLKYLCLGFLRFGIQNQTYKFPLCAFEEKNVYFRKRSKGCMIYSPQTTYNYEGLQL